MQNISLNQCIKYSSQTRPNVAQQSLWKDETKFNIPVQNTFRVLLGKPVQLENICHNTKYISAEIKFCLANERYLPNPVGRIATT